MTKFNWHESAEKKWDNNAEFWNQNSQEMWDSGSRSTIIPFFVAVRGKRSTSVRCWLW